MFFFTNMIEDSKMWQFDLKTETLFYCLLLPFSCTSLLIKIRPE